MNERQMAEIQREQQNLTRVEEIYAAFGRGDVPAILGVLSPDVLWQEFSPPALGLSGERRGVEAVTQWFGQLGQGLDVTNFEPTDFLADHDTVVAMGNETVKVRATGKVFETEWVHVWMLGEDGRITRWRGYLDYETITKALA